MNEVQKFQRDAIVEFTKAIDACEHMEQLADIGVDLFCTPCQWLKDGCREAYSRKRASLPWDKRKLLLIDSHNWFYADWHIDPDGAYDMFFRRLEKYRKRFACDWVGVAFDFGSKTFRHTLDLNYKISRQDKAPGLKELMNKVRNEIQNREIPLMQHPSYESDDMIASMVTRALVRGDEVIIASNDKDQKQLLGRGIKMIMKKGEYAKEDFVEEMKIQPSQMVDWLCLVGKDDVKGAEGIGPKRASDLLLKYGNFLGIVDRVKELPTKQKESILGFQDRYFHARRMHTLVRDIEVQGDCRLK